MDSARSKFAEDLRSKFADNLDHRYMDVRTPGVKRQDRLASELLALLIFIESFQGIGSALTDLGLLAMWKETQLVI